MWLELVIRIYQISIIDAFFLKISFLSSLLVLLGRGLFAARDFSAGELITVSPILTLPSERVEETYEDSVLVNFCYTCGAEVLSFFISLFLYFFISSLLSSSEPPIFCHLIFKFVYSLCKLANSMIKKKSGLDEVPFK